MGILQANIIIGVTSGWAGLQTSCGLYSACMTAGKNFLMLPLVLFLSLYMIIREIISSCPFLISLSVLFQWELIWCYGSYRQSAGLFAQVTILVSRSLLTQSNKNIEEMHTDIHASSGIRTHDPSVSAGEDISCLRPRGQRDRRKKIIS
jgi:hypothetical protein